MPPRAPTSHFIKLWQTNKHAYAAVHRATDGGVVAAASTAEKGLRGEGGAAPRPDKEVGIGVNWVQNGEVNTKRNGPNQPTPFFFPTF